MRKQMLWALILLLLGSGTAVAQIAAQPATQTQPAVTELKQSPQAAQAAQLAEFRRNFDLSNQVVKTVYLTHLKTPAELQDLQTALRTVLEINRIVQVASLPAIVLRGTPEQMAYADKIVAELDRARPAPPAVTQAAAAPAASTLPSYRLEFTLTEFEDSKKVNTRSYAMLLQRGTRHKETEISRFRIESRVPIATGSLQPGVGGVGSNPIVNTQFQYMDVGVNIDCELWGTDDDLTLATNIDISGISEQRNIGGLNQPVIRQLKSMLQSGINSTKPTVIATLDAADSPRRMEISVTATKVK